MSQHDPSAPGRRHFQGRPAGARPRSAHGEPGSWPPEVPEPASVPTDWSPSGAYRGHHPSALTGEPGAAPAAWLPAPTEPGGAPAASLPAPAGPGGAPAAWEQPGGFTLRSDPGSTPGWAGRQPETGPGVSWNGDTTMSGAGYRGSHSDPEPASWSGGYADPVPAQRDGHVGGPAVHRTDGDFDAAASPRYDDYAAASGHRDDGYVEGEPTAWNGSPVPDRIPAEWHDSPFPDSVPPSWNTDPPTAWNATPVEPSAASWNGPSATTGNAAPGATTVTAWHAKADSVAASARTEEKVVNPDRTAGRARRSPRLRMAAALAAAALAGGGVGAGLTAAFGGDGAVTVPADPGIGQAPAGQAPTGEPPTAQPSKAST